MKIAVNTDSYTRVGAHPYIIKELKKRSLYTENFAEADVVWNIDSIHTVGMKKGKKLTIYWEIDDFMILGSKTDFYKEADLLYVIQPEYTYYYPPNVKVLRMAADPDVHKEQDVVKDFDYSFIASIEPLDVYRNRLFLLDQLLKYSVKINQKILITNVRGEEYAKYLSRGKIILDLLPMLPNGNICLHMRLYEAMSTGCLMVDHHPFLDKIFKKDVHYLTIEKFGNVSDEEIERVKKASRQLIIEKHTWSHRVDEVLKDINDKLS